MATSVIAWQAEQRKRTVHPPGAAGLRAAGQAIG
jgi:hypothetical protein